MGAPRIRDRRSSLRSSMAVRVGGRHDRAAHGAASGPGRDVGGGSARGGPRKGRARCARSRRRGRSRDRRGASVVARGRGLDPARPRDGARPSDPVDSATGARRAVGRAGRIAAACAGHGGRYRDPRARRRSRPRLRGSSGASRHRAVSAPKPPTALPADGTRAGGRSMPGARSRGRAAPVSDRERRPLRRPPRARR